MTLFFVLGYIIFNENFCGSKVIRGLEHQIFEGTLTYKPEICEHCKKNGQNTMFVKNDSQIMNILIGQQDYKPCILMLKKQRFYCKHCKKYL